MQGSADPQIERYRKKQSNDNEEKKISEALDPEDPGAVCIHQFRFSVQSESEQNRFINDHSLIDRDRPSDRIGAVIEEIRKI